MSSWHISPITAVQHSVRSQGVDRIRRGHPGIDANDPNLPLIDEFSAMHDVGLSTSQMSAALLVRPDYGPLNRALPERTRCIDPVQAPTASPSRRSKMERG